MEANNSIPEPKPIPVSLFSRKNNKTTTLVNNANADNTFEGKHRWFEFEFVDYVYVQEIQIHATGYDSWNAISVSIAHVTGKDIELRSNHADGKFILEIGKFASGFRFRPDTKYTIFTNQLITSVVVVGYTLSEFSELEREVTSIAHDRADLQRKFASIVEREQIASDKINASELRLNELKIESGALDKEIGQATAHLDALKSEISQNSKRKDELSSATDDLKKQRSLRRKAKEQN